MNHPFYNILRAIVFFAVSVSVVSADVAPRDFSWWRAGRFGMFIHWGPASLSGKEISWSREGIGPEKYDALYKKFNPIKFDAATWVTVAKAAGMKYIVLTAKHHDGFMLWDTKTDPYNIMNTPFGRDVVAELSAAAKQADIPFCVYFSPGDWKDPDCRNPQSNDKFVERMHTQITELLTGYGKIPLVWIDFDGFPNPSSPKETATLIRKLQPGALITNRLEALHPDESHGRVAQWGDYATPEQQVGSYCSTVPWETCMTIAQQWNWRPGDQLKSLQQCLTTLVSTVGGDGNLLFNVGPKPDGEIEASQVSRLKEMGAWLEKHGEAIYGTRGGPYHPTPNYAATRKEDAIYISALIFTDNSIALPPLPAKVQSATLLDGNPVSFEQSADALTITVPLENQDPVITVIRLKIDAAPLKLAAIPAPSTSGSLAYFKPAVASSSIAPDFMHNAQAALDDNPGTFWSLGRDEKLAGEIIGKQFERVWTKPEHPVWIRNGWLEVDLESPSRVTHARISEYGQFMPVSSWAIEYQADDQWRKAAEGTSIGKHLNVTFPAPVTASKFRLVIKAGGRSAISEFQLFQDSPQ